MAKSFDPDFYVTCATVIPVLFLASTVGRSYEIMLKLALTAADSRRGRGPWTRQIRPYLTARILKFGAYAIWVAGAIGEFLALIVLYQGHEGPGDREAVLAATLILVLAASAGPLGAYLNVRRKLENLGFPSQMAAARDAAAAESRAPQQAADS